MAKAQEKAGGRARRAVRLLLAGLVLLGSVTAARAEPSVAQMLKYQPHQEGIDFSTPGSDATSACKVELVKGQKKGSGWLLRDGNGQALRWFFDTNDDKKIDVWAYFKDGAEVFREIDTTGSGRPDQFRWLNAGGMKWGLADIDGKIKSWKAISPEEVSQEIITALIKQDFARFQALLITDAEMKDLNLPTEMVERIQDKQKTAATRFRDLSAKLNLAPTARWVHLETRAPRCLPSDQIGTRYDLVKHGNGTILYDVNGKNEKNDWLQTGEIIQVGMAWRLTDVPTPGAASDDSTDETNRRGGNVVANLDNNPVLLKLVEELGKIDEEKQSNVAGTDVAVVRHHLQRADLLEKIVALVKPGDRDPWIRQVADSLSTAAQASPKGESAAMTRLLSLEGQLAQKMTGSNLAAYVTFREMQTDYARKIDEKDFAKVQAEWLKRLTEFVQAYPKAEDTPDAMLQAGMVSEFLEKDVDAKNWYTQLRKNFPDKIQGVKAGGGLWRLASEGQPFRLAAPLLADPNQVFDIDTLKNKVVIVYYWAAWNSQSVGDFAKLKLLLDTYGKKGVELVCINLDNKPEEARDFLSRSPAPGAQIYKAGGLESKLATDYGIFVLPHLFVIDRTGNVANRKVQIGNLEEEIKKQMAK